MRQPEHDDEHDLGLAHDLPTLLTRRRALGGLLGTAGLAFLAACGAKSEATANGSPTPSLVPSPAGSSATGAAATTQIPEETGGPFPGDGSNGVNVLDDAGIIRSDITRSFGASTTKAEGIPLTIALTVLDVAGGGGPLAGAAVYLWHCDREGRYSLYDSSIADENYLRGVQVADAQGKVSFTSVFPAAYSGRWPHAHFEVYRTVNDATGGGTKLRTSQLALPKAACDQVYATAGYEQSVSNLAQTSLERDMVFSDGYSLQLATVTGDVTQGMTARLNVPV